MKVFHLSAVQLNSRLLKLLEKPKTEKRNELIFQLKLAIRIKIRELEKGEEIRLGQFNHLIGKTHTWGTLLVDQAPYDGSISSLVERIYS